MICLFKPQNYEWELFPNDLNHILYVFTSVPNNFYINFLILILDKISHFNGFVNLEYQPLTTTTIIPVYILNINHYTSFKPSFPVNTYKPWLRRKIPQRYRNLFDNIFTDNVYVVLQLCRYWDDGCSFCYRA